MKYKFLVSSFCALLTFGHLLYAEQEKTNEEVNADAYLINHLIAKYADMNLVIEDVEERSDMRPWPHEMFLKDCLFDNALSGVIANIHSNDPDKKKHAQEIIVRMQQELKKYMGLREKRRDELIADQGRYEKLTLGVFIGFSSALWGLIAVRRNKWHNLAVFSSISSALSLFAYLFSLKKLISIVGEKNLMNMSYNDMENICGVLDAILLS